MKRRWKSIHPSGHFLPSGFRSKLEQTFSALLDSKQIKWQYEPRIFDITLRDGSASTYRPDFYLPALDRWVEIKGHWWGDSREKVECFMEQYPALAFSVVGQGWKTLLGKAW